MNELIKYFVAMGMPAEIATQLATQISRTTPPPPPVANGIKLDPNDAVVNLLTTKYGLDPQSAIGYAGHILRHEATGSRALQEEALSAQAGREVNRMHNISNFAEAAKIPQEQRTPRQQDNYQFVDNWAKDYRRKEAEQFAKDDATAESDRSKESAQNEEDARQEALDRQEESAAESDRDRRAKAVLEKDKAQSKADYQRATGATY